MSVLVRVKIDTYYFFTSVFYQFQQIELALPAILGQRSAHSLATGPVMPDPFISPLGLTMTPALSEAANNFKSDPYMYLDKSALLDACFLLE